MADDILDAFFDALTPVMDVLLDIIPFPINAVVGFIYGGIRELLTEVLFD